MLDRAIIEIHITSGFQKSFRKLPQNLQDLATKKDRIFRENAFDSRLKTHKLHRELEGFWAYSITYSYRVMFRFEGAHSAVYYDIGTHGIYK